MDAIATLQVLGMSAALGALVGLERERAGSAIGGIRTFPLIAVLGTVCALLAEPYGAWTVASGLIAVVAMLGVANFANRPEAGNGITTEIAALLVYTIGAYLVSGHAAVAAVAGGTLALLLHFKESLHDTVRKMGPGVVAAIMRFVLISLVILPLLPNRAYGPYAVLNPREIWLMVVLIVGIGLGGYIANAWFGARAGALLGGVLGGLISSTATTIGFARRARGAPEAAGLAAVVIAAASTVALGRVLVEIAAVAPTALRAMAPPVACLFGVMAVISLGMWLVSGRARAELPAQGNPAELRSALIFAGLYALIIFVVAAVKDRFGSSGLYVVAVISGMTDMDAITLSTARLVENGTIGVDTGWRVVVIAALANLVFKGGAAAVLGGWALGWRVLSAFAVVMVAGLALLVAWPDGGGLIGGGAGAPMAPSSQPPPPTIP